MQQATEFYDEYLAKTGHLADSELMGMALGDAMPERHAAHLDECRSCQKRAAFYSPAYASKLSRAETIRQARLIERYGTLDEAARRGEYCDYTEPMK